MSDINLIGPGIGGLMAYLISDLYFSKVVTLGEYETDATTEQGEYHVHITRMGSRRPYIKVKIQDKTRNRQRSKTFRQKHLMQQYDADNLDEVVDEILRWYEDTALNQSKR
ncbi:MAG: hypothetical protein ACOYEF_01915 [Planifilum sp.]|jgi:hypothetical protein